MTILDISKWQGAISQAAFASMRAGGVTRLIHKAGGSNAGRYTDSQYHGNVQRARAAGLALGHYWFNGTGDPAADAAYFVKNLDGYTDGDWLVIDVENEGSMPSWSPAQVLAWVNVVKAAHPKATIVAYMSSSVTKAKNWQAVVDAGVKLWVAQYSSAAPTVAYWPGWIAWQFTSSGQVPSFGGRVDLSRPGSSTEGTVPASTTTASLSGRNITKWPTSKVQAKVGANADGIYGPDTTAKVKAWQKANGLDADGIFGPASAAKMFGTAAPTTAAAKPAAAKLDVDGVWGPDTTRALQTAVHAPADGKLGPITYRALQQHLGVPADGVYGPQTKRALQKRVGVDQDAVIGPKTVRALQAKLNAGTF